MLFRSLVVSASRISDCEGFPLLYLEESDNVLFKGSTFEGNTGGNFIEVYAESGVVESLPFGSSSFRGNQVDYFAGTRLLPLTESCVFADNSFDENWESDSVVPAADDSDYYGGGQEATAGDSGAGDSGTGDSGGPQWYDHPSGLSFSYPGEWETQEYPAQSRVGVFAPDGQSLVFFLTAYKIPESLASRDLSSKNEVKQAKKVFADASAALGKLLKDEAGVVLSLKVDGEPFAGNGLTSADYTGNATKGDGEKAEARVCLIIFDGKVHAMAGLAADASALEAGGEMDGIFGSVEATAGGE